MGRTLRSVHHPAPIPNPFEKHQIREAGSALRWAEVAATLRAAGRGGSGEQTAEGLLGPPLEYTLRPGDVLYVPRGAAHEAFAPAEAEAGSLHLTLGLVTESDSRYWMLRNQLLALCKGRGAPAISCAGALGAAIIALKDEPLQGGWLRGAPPFGWVRNATARRAEFDSIWSHLEQLEGRDGVAVGEVGRLQAAVRADVDEEAVVEAEHIGFLKGEMPSCAPMDADLALRWSPPKAKAVAGLGVCLAFAPKAAVSWSAAEAEGVAYTLQLRIGGRKAKGKRKPASLPIASARLLPALEFVRERLKQAKQHGAAGFVVGALPVADQWSRMALAQALLSHGIVSARPDVQVKGIDAATADAQGYAEADTLCSLSVQHGPTKKKPEL